MENQKKQHGILNINNQAISVIEEQDMLIKILNHDNITLKLIDNMIILLEELSKQYPKNIKISKGE